MNDPRPNPEGGFTLIEMVITSAVLVPLLFAALTTNSLVQRHVSADVAAADVDGTLDRLSDHLYALTRAAVVASVEVRSDRADSWAAPVGTTAYSATRFASDDPSEPALEIEFVRDAGETANGIDDDGDGLVDEGRLELRRGSSGRWTTAATGIELMTARLEGRLMVYSIQCARRDQDRHVLRSRREVRIFLRN